MKLTTIFAPKLNKLQLSTILHEETRLNYFCFVFREEQQWDETVNTDDSDDEKEQVYGYKLYKHVYK